MKKKVDKAHEAYSSRGMKSKMLNPEKMGMYDQSQDKVKPHKGKKLPKAADGGKGASAEAASMAPGAGMGKKAGKGGGAMAKKAKGAQSSMSSDKKDMKCCDKKDGRY